MKALLRWLPAVLGCWIMVSSRVIAAEPEPSAAEADYRQAVESLHWISGPTTVDVPGKSRLVIPADHVFLDAADTRKFLELNQNLGSGEEVMVAPRGLPWAAYLSFSDEGYVKDDEKIDADALLKAMQDSDEQQNDARRRRGWPPLHIVGWAVPPAYNSTTKRLEWATLLESGGRRNVNFSTKVLGRRGHTSVILVSGTDELATARPQLENVLAGYSFNAGETYAEWVPGDKVAEYGLAALVLGGAAAIAAKKGLWAVLAGFLATGWKFVLAAGIALLAGIRRVIFGKKAG